MVKHTIGDHPKVTINFHVAVAFFGPGHKFVQPDFREPIKNFKRNKAKLVVVGTAFTKCSIFAPETLLNKIEVILRTLIGKPIGDVERIEIDKKCSFAIKDCPPQGALFIKEDCE